jgi:hypothetical protein
MIVGNGVGLSSTCSGSLNEFRPGLDHTPSLETASLHSYLREAGLVVTAMLRARHDGTGPSLAVSTCAAEDLELPRPRRLLLTAGWNLTESVGLPVAAYLMVGSLDGRDAGLIAGLVAIWLTAAIRKVATGSVPSLRMHGLTGGDWKRAATCGTAPVPDPPRS